MKNNTIKEILQKKIAEKKISISALARLANVHQDTVYKFLSGKSDMLTENINKLFAALDKIKKSDC